MFEKFIEEYGNIEHIVELPNDHLEQVKSFLPEEHFSFIANGAGSYMDGFFWLLIRCNLILF